MMVSMNYLQSKVTIKSIIFEGNSHITLGAIETSIGVLRQN